MTTNHAVCTFDFTLPETFPDGQLMTKDEVKGWLDNIAKKWTFQHEVGKDGYRHFQGRLSLKVKKRLATMVDEKPWRPLHLSITSNENRENNFYVVKEEGRVDGPWSDKDVAPPYIPRQVREITDWRPWQKTCEHILTLWDTRSVHCVVNPTGFSGKSVLVAKLGSMRKINQIPYCNDYKDILRMVMDRPKLGAYIIDMPRAINKERLFQLYAAIETVKSGYAYDDRYSFKEEYFDCPQIFVFTNEMPDMKLLSGDRWKIWTINTESWELVPMNHSGVSMPPDVPVVPAAPVVLSMDIVRFPESEIVPVRQAIVPIVPSPVIDSGILNIVTKGLATAVPKPFIDTSSGVAVARPSIGVNK